jgi:hypothetical protein
MVLICYRCSTPQSADQLRGGVKLKNVDKEVAAMMRRCMSCDCRTFITTEAKE